MANDPYWNPQPGPFAHVVLVRRMEITEASETLRFREVSGTTYADRAPKPREEHPRETAHRRAVHVLGPKRGRWK